MESRSTIVVTGIGLVTCLGTCAQESCIRAIRGDSGIAGFTRFDVSSNACRAAASVPGFELESLLRIPKNRKFMNRSVEFAMLAAYDAITATGLDLARVDPLRIGLQLGSGQSGLEPAEFFAALDLTSQPGGPSAYNELGGRPSRLLDRYFPLRSLANAGAGLLSAEICARGSGNNFVQSDTASAMAIGTAYYDLLEGRCDVAIAGGYDSLLSLSTYLAYSHQGLLSHADPESAYRPFDRERDGLVLGEGAGMLVLEREEDAQRRGAVILGEIAGFGSSTDVSDSVQAVGSESTVRAACEQAIGNSEVDFLIAHGIGTPDGDCREAALLSAIFGSKLPITAFKSQTGYLGAATAAVELGLALLSVQQNLIPPIAHHQNSDDGCILDFVSGKARPLSSGQRSFLCMNWSWTGQCTAIMARAAQGR